MDDVVRSGMEKRTFHADSVGQSGSSCPCPLTNIGDSKVSQKAIDGPSFMPDIWTLPDAPTGCLERGDV